MDADNVPGLLGVLAEPNRFRIVELLRGGPRPVNGIVEALGLGQPQVSRHLKVLGEAGFVTAHRQAQQRIYRLRPEPFQEIDAWFATFARIWEDRLDRLDALLADDEGNAP
ncbi:metalloregulator ArsR/SmtB family transcription factor [Actinomadura kijaniata]|uniref:DNA-binding transcriptional ArsR family regulator n=1 Tax=Actinomadura namibiensis TaxID=182080 RepID=A0A7W3LWN4_ACTNM|nr:MULTISPECIES: metalloregulator ArsR/SmtB family transcription factor [Actinomadura]MBA8955612.1 DNA-binding transcriptional ArsR family regulator [Actinomadura namibiensis]